VIISKSWYGKLHCACSSQDWKRADDATLAQLAKVENDTSESPLVGEEFLDVYLGKGKNIGNK